MSLNLREFWTVAHGMIFGAIYLLAFAGGLAGLWSMRGKLLTTEGVGERLGRMRLGMWVMTVMAWLTVISGTYIVYPWYRAPIPESPRSKLVADVAMKAWHSFGMEWKEHFGWFSPILATAVLYIVLRYGDSLSERDDIRNAVTVLFVVAFLGAAVAGLFGAFLNKVAPIL
ncbi:MAG: hypothetical protein O2807_14200 [bacterium]|nr:hypothetical protein [bacterium]